MANYTKIAEMGQRLGSVKFSMEYQSSGSLDTFAHQTFIQLNQAPLKQLTR
jgi:hypothetical protein